MAAQAGVHFEADMDPIEAAAHFINLWPEIRTFQVAVTKKGEKPIFSHHGIGKEGLVGGRGDVCVYTRKKNTGVWRKGLKRYTFNSHPVGIGLSLCKPFQFCILEKITGR